jgi:murein DD-endopeptidase MepM/ murein hydrolase activator NlpD
VPYQADRGAPSATSTDTTPMPDRTAMRTPDRYHAAEQRPEPQRYASNGESIEVQPGDTPFAIAKRHGVPVMALLEANGLQNGATIKPGQRLVLPAGASRTAVLEPQTRTPMAVRPAEPARNTSADTPGWDGRYTMNPGDSLYAIARQHRVTLAELQRVNGISDPTKVRAGTVLQIPGGAADSGAGSATGSLPQTTTGGPRVIQVPTGVQTRPVDMTDNRVPDNKIASRGDTATDAVAGAKFRWPLSGRMLVGFGPQPDGTHNDGINVGVPQGTEVRAAESGRVAYAGNELKGYGNLILIRHDNGWVTAYAHSDEILVKRDDVVRRGQVIARAGKTGTVSEPQLHFELRQGSKPVDPVPYLERN